MLREQNDYTIHESETDYECGESWEEVSHRMLREARAVHGRPVPLPKVPNTPVTDEELRTVAALYQASRAVKELDRKAEAEAAARARPTNLLELNPYRRQAVLSRLGPFGDVAPAVLAPAVAALRVDKSAFLIGPWSVWREQIRTVLEARYVDWAAKTEPGPAPRISVTTDVDLFSELEAEIKEERRAWAKPSEVEDETEEDDFEEDECPALATRPSLSGPNTDLLIIRIGRMVYRNALVATAVRSTLLTRRAEGKATWLCSERAWGPRHLAWSEHLDSDLHGLPTLVLDGGDPVKMWPLARHFTGLKTKVLQALGSLSPESLAEDVSRATGHWARFKIEVAKYVADHPFESGDPQTYFEAEVWGSPEWKNYDRIKGRLKDQARRAKPGASEEKAAYDKVHYAKRAKAKRSTPEAKALLAQRKRDERARKRLAAEKAEEEALASVLSNV